MGTEADLAWYHGILAQAFEIGSCTVISTDQEDAKSVKILNRMLRLDDTGLVFEADPRHVELLARSLKLNNCRKISTTGQQINIDDVEGFEEETEDACAAENPADVVSASFLPPPISKRSI